MFSQLSSSVPLQYATESESNLQQVRTLLASAQRDKMELANQLEEEKRYNPNLQCAPVHVCDALFSKWDAFLTPSGCSVLKQESGGPSVQGGGGIHHQRGSRGISLHK